MRTLLQRACRACVAGADARSSLFLPPLARGRCPARGRRVSTTWAARRPTSIKRRKSRMIATPSRAARASQKSSSCFPDAVRTLRSTRFASAPCSPCSRRHRALRSRSRRRRRSSSPPSRSRTTRLTTRSASRAARTPWCSRWTGLLMLLSGHAMRRMHLRHHARPLEESDLEGVGARRSALMALLGGPANALALRVAAFRGARRHERIVQVLETLAGLAIVAVPSPRAGRRSPRSCSSPSRCRCRWASGRRTSRITRPAGWSRCASASRSCGRRCCSAWRSTTCTTRCRRSRGQDLPRRRRE